ncbi:MAG: glycosyltransferase, partial [Nocardioidaceae bacterium]|nr:glycosyltransferase [Nocardioidaceae bacterium]
MSQFDEVMARRRPESLPTEVLLVWLQLLVRAGRDDELTAVLSNRDVTLSDADRWMLQADLLNPHRRTSQADDGVVAEERWLTAFNEIYAQDGLEPILLRPAVPGQSPYQRLRAPTSARVDGDLVTVVMSTYEPDRDLLMAVRGVLDQTWHNLELLVMDDASSPESWTLLEEAEAHDSRVRVVRAPHNRGTYAARNRALALASGRWMTFQDSDDWTHPRRVEHQVRHLQENPRVLANRTWTLRAYADMTMTYVGYSAHRMNASSLLFDRVQVESLVGGFDATRKSGDMEWPLRLRAVRPGSVRDLAHPAPLAITQLREGSLSRSDAGPGWTRWDRLSYRDSYLEWHGQVRAGRRDPVLPAATRPFPLPRPAWEPDRAAGAGPDPWQVAVLGDVRQSARGTLRTVGVARAAAVAGLRTAVAHAESTRPLSAQRGSLSSGLSRDVRTGRLGVTNASEADAVDLLVITEPTSVLHVDHAALRVGDILVVVDEETPHGWSVPDVDRRCQELFGTAPLWGGPAAVHDQPERPSRVRQAVPDERWCHSDLAPVAGDAWFRVGTGHRYRPLDQRPGAASVPATVVVGHHLEDDRRRWPTSAAGLRAVYPSSCPPSEDRASGDTKRFRVELHGLHGLTTPMELLQHTHHPSSWVPLTTTGMSVREFLSHID